MSRRSVSFFVCSRAIFPRWPVSNVDLCFEVRPLHATKKHIFKNKLSKKNDGRGQRNTSLIRNSLLISGVFLMSEVPLYPYNSLSVAFFKCRSVF